MKLSTNRILTTHTGSLPRPTDLIELIQKVETGGNVDPAAFEARIKSAVAETVQKQVDAGIDVLNDGEAGKPGYSTYVKDRLTGFGGTSRNTNINAEGRDFPEWMSKRNISGNVIARPACDGPVAWSDFAAVEREIANLKAAVAGVKHEEVFMSAASPGVIATFLPNEYYPSHEAYIEALAGVMRDEYNAIVNAGFVLQLDCPDLAMTRHNRHIDATLAEFRTSRSCTSPRSTRLRRTSRRSHVAPLLGQLRRPAPHGRSDDRHHRHRSRAAPRISFEGANPRHSTNGRSA